MIANAFGIGQFRSVKRFQSASKPSGDHNEVDDSTRRKPLWVQRYEVDCRVKRQRLLVRDHQPNAFAGR
jgi:hypothetical protein